jgi:hypothetical protein
MVLPTMYRNLDGGFGTILGESTPTARLKSGANPRFGVANG